MVHTDYIGSMPMGQNTRRIELVIAASKRRPAASAAEAGGRRVLI
jgi:hypothetical protein